MKHLVLAALLLNAASARAADLLATLAHGTPAQLVDTLARLGTSIDLSDQAQVLAAIGPVTAVQTRGQLGTDFVAYANAGGEVVWNLHADRDRIVLLALPRDCVPLGVLESRFQGPEFRAPVRKSTVVLYNDMRYRERQGMAFTYEYHRGCISSFGLAQDRTRT